MTSTLDEPVDQEERVETQADFLPDSFGPPVAAGPEIDSAEERSARLDDGRMRRLVPTPRQVELGAEYPDFDEAMALAREEPQAKARLRQRAAVYLSNINPWTIPGAKTPLVVFGLMNLLTTWDDAAMQLIGPELRGEFGMSIQTLINFITLSSLFAILGGIPFGYLVDRVKRTWLVRFGSIGSNVASMVKAMATGQGLFMGGTFMAQLGAMTAGPAQYPLMADYYPSRARARVAAYLGVARQVGTVVGLPVAGYLIVTFGWRYAVLGLAAVGVLTSALTFLIREPVRGGMDRLEMGLSRELAGIEQRPPTWQEGFRTAWSVRTLRRNAYASVVQQFTLPVNTVIGLIQAERFFLDTSQRATVATVQALLIIPALVVGGTLGDRLLALRPSSLAVFQSVILAFIGITTIINGLVPNLYLFILFSVLIGAAGAVVTPLSAAVSSLVIPARARGVGLQVFAPFALIGLAFAPVLIRLADRLPLQQALIMFAPLYFVAALIVLSTAATIERDIRAARAAALAGLAVDTAKKQGVAKLIVCRDVDVSYDGVQILFNVDLDVEEGECLALLGTNGAGKSTLLRAIAGVVESDNGAIFFEDDDITHVPAHQNAARGIVLMPGGAAVFPTMTVRENLTVAGSLRRGETTDAGADIERVLSMFPVLRDRLDLLAGTMSGGEQQMLALGQAFLMQPRLLMIDELSLGLAPAVIEQLLGTLREIQRQGTTVILVEQSLNVAVTVAERAVFMEKGEIRFDGPTEELLQRPDLIRSIFMGGAVAGAVPRVRRGLTGIDDETAPALQVEGLSVAFGGVQALRDVALSMAPGEVVGVIGPNGAGKTTLFDVISGFVEADAGTVMVDGRDVTRLSPDARARLGLGRAFQNARLFPPLTVRENIAIALDRRAVRSPILAAVWAPPLRRSEQRLATRIDGYIEILGLGPFADKFLSELSTGTRRAVEVACQMAAEPKILLLDEPSSGLAQAETEALGPALLRVVRETGCAMLVIEHDLPLITSISDRLVAMELGEVVVTGTPQEVATNERVLRSYLAASDDVIERSGSRIGQVLSVISSEKGTASDGHGD